MTPPPVASLGMDRLSGASMNATPAAWNAPRGRPSERGLSIAPILACVWRVGRGSELVLRLALPVEPGARGRGELAFAPATTSTEHHLIGTRDSLVGKASQQWRVEAQRIGEGEYELVLSEIHAPNAVHVKATLATVLRGGSDSPDAPASDTTSVLVLTSLPSAVGLRGGTYVLRRAGFAPEV